MFAIKRFQLILHLALLPFLLFSETRSIEQQDDGVSIWESVTSIDSTYYYDGPLIWNINKLKQLKLEVDYNNETFFIIKSADEYCEIEPVVVTTKKYYLSNDIDPHCYYSIGQYWWPDSLNSGTYVRRDGITNPASKHYDREKLSELRKRCRILSQAYYITGNKKYYKAFIGQLKAWFLNKRTYMYPNFEYAGVVPGQFDDKGRGAGTIYANDFNDVIESIRLVNSVKKINKRTMRGLKKWFEDFVLWIETNNGVYLIKKNNNIGLASDVLLVNIYLFSGNEKRAKVIADRFDSLRLNIQIAEDGRQPAELQRTNAFMYSLANLEYVLDFCYLARYWYPNYYEEHHERIDAAFDFLGQYVDNPHAFPYQQIIGWKDCKKDYQLQLDRLYYLRDNSN